MTSSSFLAFAAALFSGALAVAVLFRKRRSFASWCFFAGMGTLAVESALGGMSLQASHPEKVAYWQSLALVTKSFLPGFWLAFSLSYSRGNYLKFLATWKYLPGGSFSVADRYSAWLSFRADSSAAPVCRRTGVESQLRRSGKGCERSVFDCRSDDP